MLRATEPTTNYHFWLPQDIVGIWELKLYLHQRQVGIWGRNYTCIKGKWVSGVETLLASKAGWYLGVEPSPYVKGNRTYPKLPFLATTGHGGYLGVETLYASKASGYLGVETSKASGYLW